MADNMSHNSAQSKEKMRPGGPSDREEIVPERKKTPSFQITSVTVATRVSNDGGDDSADDLDDSRTDDISEAVDASRVTDLETPSFSEESFSKEDVFFNTSAAALGSAPVIPTSSQYGLAIVANLEGDSASASSPVSTNSISNNDVHVNVSEAGGVLNIVGNNKPNETESGHSHPGRNERFKVVKIESTEPFKRGRWMCMDYLDHTTQPPQPQQHQQHTHQPLQQPQQLQQPVPLVQHQIAKTDCNDVMASNIGLTQFTQDGGVIMNDNMVKTVVSDEHQSGVIDPNLLAQMTNTMIAPVSSPDQHQQALLASQRHQVAQQNIALGQMATSNYQSLAGQSLPHVTIPSSQPQQVVIQSQQLPPTMPQPMTQNFQQQTGSAPGMPQQILSQQHPQSMSQVPYQPQPVSQHQSLPQQQLQHVMQVHQQQYQQHQQPTIPQMQQIQQMHQQQIQHQQQLLQQQSQQQQQLQQQQLAQMQQLQQQQIAAAMQQQHQVLPQVPQQPPHSAAQHTVMSQVVQQQATHMTAPAQQTQYYNPQQGPIIHASSQPKVVTIQQAQGLPPTQTGGYPTQTSMSVTQTQNVNSTTHLPAMSQGASLSQQSMQQSMAQAQSLQAQSLQAQTLQAQLPPQPHQHPQHPSHQQPLQMGQSLQQMQTLAQGQSLPQSLTSSSVPQPAPQQQQQMTHQLAGQSLPQMQAMPPAQGLSQSSVQQPNQQLPHPQLPTQSLPQMQTMAQVQNIPQSISQSSVPQPAPQQGQIGISQQQMISMQMPQSQNTLLAAQQQHYPMVSNASPQAFPNPVVSSSTSVMSPHTGGAPGVPSSNVSSVVDPVTGTVLSSVNNPVELQTAQAAVGSIQGSTGIGPSVALLESLVEATSVTDEVAPGNDDTESASGTNAVAIDNKIEQAMDLVKSHLMFAVREEVEVLKEKIAELMDRINQLELENSILKAHATQETLAQLNSNNSSSVQSQGQQVVSQGQSQQTPPQSTQAPQQQNGS